jgi:hypothetical protein
MLPAPIALAASFAMVFVLSVSVAALSWWGFESRVLALRHRVPFRGGSR